MGETREMMILRLKPGEDGEMTDIYGITVVWKWMKDVLE